MGLWDYGSQREWREMVLQLDTDMSILTALIKQIKFVPSSCHGGNGENWGEVGAGLPSLTSEPAAQQRAQKGGDRDKVFYSPAYQVGFLRGLSGASAGFAWEHFLKKSLHRCYAFPCGDAGPLPPGMVWTGQ